MSVFFLQWQLCYDTTGPHVCMLNGNVDGGGEVATAFARHFGGGKSEMARPSWVIQHAWLTGTFLTGGEVSVPAHFSVLHSLPERALVSSLAQPG